MSSHQHNVDIQARVSFLDQVCRFLAVVGALVLVALSIITVISVIGRYLFGTPVDGDFELVEMGCAVGIALFLPYCQLRNGNVIVDFVTARAPVSMKNVLDAFGCLLISLAGFVLAWRLALGGYDLQRYNDQTMVLHINTWYAYVVIVPSFALLGIVGLVTAVRALKNQLPPNEAL
ncbi:MAG: hypothetical protein DHS20C01_26660 [marine bacterium B5-7]|nr:MAG: hypothetical protein DHS20C01_26660 [marine bacterium B5-7]